MPRARVALLWHMHQPVYRDPESGEYILPWVRLHATRSYYDMARVLAEFPKARATINLVPSLLSQLEDYIEGRARDRFLELTVKPAELLDAAERAFLLKNFFMVDWETCIKPLPRFEELLQKRGLDIKGVDLEALGKKWSADELRDLQVLFNLAWFGFCAEEEEVTLRDLKKKARLFTEADKAAMLAVQKKIVSQVMPALAAVAKSGQAELTVTPFYHPILPLLCDSDSARRAMPGAALPTRFSWPDDAHEQVKRALNFAQSRLSVRPRGMWPAEGSVSPEALAVFADEGVEYVCSDEEVLLKSLPPGASRSAISRTWLVDAGNGRSIKMLFRDRGLSDLVGFTYQKTPAKTAVADFLGHLGRIADTFHASLPTGSAALPTIAVILDGENAWEHYANSGRDFLRGLYGALARQDGGIEPVTLGEAFDRSPPTERLARIHSGSWISANYRIWIGHPEDNLGWEFLGQARALLGKRQREGFDPALCQAAREALLVAEGSDWFWWFGDDFSTDSLAEFDALFRGYVLRAFTLLQEDPPSRLLQPIAQRVRGEAKKPAATPTGPEPWARIQPALDGRHRSYFGWLGAAEYVPEGDAGAMHQGADLFDRVAYGFDKDMLYVRMDTRGGPADKRLPGQVTLLELRLRSAAKARDLRVQLGEGGLAKVEGGQGRGAVRDSVTLGFTWAELGFSPGERVAMSILAYRDEVVVERLPRRGSLGFDLPAADFDLRHWGV